MYYAVIIWVLLCYLVGSIAKRLGRNFWEYFLFSLLLSPLIGGIVLAIQGRQPDETNPHLYYCNNCGSVYSGYNQKERLCPDCANELIETSVYVSEWRNLGDPQKNALKQAFANGERLTFPIIKDGNAVGDKEKQENASVDAIKKYKELLDMGAITQEEYEAKKKQLLGL